MRNRLIFFVFALSGSATVFSESLPLRGYDWWAGIARHPAVVNSVTADKSDPFLISLRGEWEYAIGRHGNGWRTWGFQYSDLWPVSGTLLVPGCWEAQGVGEPGLGKAFLCQDNAEKPIRNFYRGEIWYRKSVTIPEQWAGRRIWFKTGGFRSRGSVWINNRPVARVSSFCSTVKYDITPFVEPGKPAKIVISVNNAVSPRNVQLNCPNRWGGIWRDVELESTPYEAWIDDAWVRGDFDRREAQVHVDVCFAKEAISRKRHLRVDIEGTCVETSELSKDTCVRVPLSSFRAWSPASPNLYVAKIDLFEDGKLVMSRKERFGVRKIEVRGKSFYLNNKPFFVRGFGDDSVYPIHGLTPADRGFHLKHMQIARKAGFNFARLHTHVELPEYFEAADEAGILVQPEMSYYMDNPEDDFEYDPMSDVEELWRNYRRYPSFGCYSGGNEGSLGPYAGQAVFDWIKKHDPDRLSIEQDGGSYLLAGHGEGRTTHCSGPLMPWERGSFNPDRPFIAHEYLNLCVKSDSRHERDYTGAWVSPVTRSDRAWWLRQHGLDMQWGDMLQNSQHALQKFWQKQGLEAARMDPYCDGYCFWTIVDVVVRNEPCKTYSAQGLFDPFWRSKTAGFTPEEFARFNSPSCVLLDNEGRADRVYRDNNDRSLLNSPWSIEAVQEGTNRVYSAGETIHADFLFAHYGEEPIDDARIEWTLTSSEGEVLASGNRDIGRQDLGAVRLVAREKIAVADIVRPCKAVLAARIGEVSNSWDFYLFPRRKALQVADVSCVREFFDRLAPRYPGLRLSGEQDKQAKIAIVAEGSEEMRRAVAAGKTVIALANQQGPANISLGWWNIGAQCGTAIRRHPALKNLPYEPYLTPLFFRIIKNGSDMLIRHNTGTDVPKATGIGSEDVVIAGEGGTACYYYFAVTRTPSGANCFHVSGLDVLSDTPEGTALLDGILEEAGNGAR